MEQKLLYDITYIILTTCAVAVLARLFAYINAKIDKAQTEGKLAQHTLLNKYIDSAQAAITTAVMAVSQTYVDNVKKAGNFDATAQATAKTEAVDLAKKLISENEKIAIETVRTDYEAYIDKAVEAAIKKIALEGVEKQ